MNHKELLEKVAQEMPSGSGFDTGQWHVREDNGQYSLTSEYHAMHESCMYAGWYDVEVSVSQEELALPFDELVERLTLGALEAVDEIYDDPDNFDDLYWPEEGKYEV